MKAYFYFALSILWRGSVADWPNPFDGYRRALGRKYEEEFRVFLLDSKGCRRKTHVDVFVDFEIPSQTALMVPNFTEQATRRYKFWCHNFAIPGIMFNVLIGADTDNFIPAGRSGSLWSIYFHEWRNSESGLYKRAALMVKEAESKGKLARG